MRKRRCPINQNSDETPSWILTFSDLTTLLLTFFVLLVSMASLTDVSKRKVALGSVSGKFGTGAPSLDDLSTTRGKAVEPGPMNLFGDLQEIKKRVSEDPDSDLHFEFNDFIQRVVMDADVLFAPGAATLTPGGQQLLDEIRPVLLESAYPLDLAGHTAEGRDEYGPDYLTPADGKVDFSWRLSLERVGAVYQYFVATGVPMEKLRVEAFGKFRPKVGESSLAERRSNRRVDITLDKRIGSWLPISAAELLEAQEAAKAAERKRFRVGDYFFRFDLSE